MGYRTQAKWDAERSAAKAAAAEAIVANREDAVHRLLTERGEAKASELAGFKSVQEAKAAAGASGEQGETDTVKPYTEWTNADLADELEARGLAKSGNKDELVARLEESDAAEAEDDSSSEDE